MSYLYKYKYSIYLFVILNLIVSLIFIIVNNNKLIFDDIYSTIEINRYLLNGISNTSLYNHIHPAGPGGYIFLAYIGKIFGNNIISFHLAAYFSFLLIFCGYFLSIGFKSKYLLYSLFFLLLSPHLPLSMVSALTEGPSMFFALFGSYFFLKSMEFKKLSYSLYAHLFLCSLFVGLSIISRQYYIALIPTMLIITIIKYYFIGRNIKLLYSQWISIFLASLPILYLFLLWGGLTSPGMYLGKSYEEYIAGIGFNYFRFISPVFYLGLTSSPFVLLSMNKNNINTYFYLILVSIIFTSCIFILDISVINNGPVNFFLNFIKNINNTIYLFSHIILLIISFFSVLYLLLLIFNNKEQLFSNLIFLYCFIFITIFILEQFLVSGNIPYYERYNMQLMPFLGVIVFTLLPKFNRYYLLYLLFILTLGQLMIWRYVV